MLFISCSSNHQRFKPVAEAIKRHCLKEIPDIKNVDTIYLMIQVVTPRLRNILQSAEYRWAWTEAKRDGNPDSTFFRDKSDDILDQTDHFDSTRLLYYHARDLVIYTKNNLQKGMAEEGLYFNIDLGLVPKYSLIQKIARTDPEGITIRPYVTYTSEEYETYRKNNILKYF
jgi:hypothetical protein